MSTSPKGKKPGSDILLPGSTRSISIGTTGKAGKKSYDVDFDDALKLRAFMAAKRDILEDIEALPDDADEATQMAFIDTTSERVETVVDAILGAGAYAEIFEGRKSLFGGLVLLGELEKQVAPAYDAAFAKYAPDKS